jgi:hypothetical protein
MTVLPTTLQDLPAPQGVEGGCIGDLTRQPERENPVAGKSPGHDTTEDKAIQHGRRRHRWNTAHRNTRYVDFVNSCCRSPPSPCAAEHGDVVDGAVELLRARPIAVSTTPSAV